MHRTTSFTTVLLTIVLLVALVSAAGAASITTQVLKGAAIGFVVTKAAGPLDKFINTVTLRNGMKTSLSTKVVPILSVGEKGYIGGAQVCGPKSLVNQVQAVFQYEKNFSHNNYRAKVLLPSASLNPLKLQRVAKVGVSAIIDVALNGALEHKTVGTGIKAGDVIRGAGVLVAIKNFGPEVNKALNTITFNKGYATKVVPMASVGEKMYLGGAQVSASSGSINSINAVWQYEDLFSDGRFRVKVVVPTTSSNPLKMKRVDGAGLTALIDMALSQQEEAEDAQLRARRNEWFNIGGRNVGSYMPPIKIGGSTPIRIEPKEDNGKHKGWEIGKHKGWDKKKH